MGWEEEREREGGENDFPSGPSTNDIHTEGKKEHMYGRLHEFSSNCVQGGGGSNIPNTLQTSYTHVPFLRSGRARSD